MAGKRQQFSPRFRAKVALAALKERKTLNELASEFQVNPTQISRWKKLLLEGSLDIFSHGNSSATKAKKLEKKDAALLQKIGQLTMEVNWLKKKLKVYQQRASV